MCALVAGCALEEASSPPPPPRTSIARRTQALGVPQNGFPSYGEAMIYMLTNRARADPAAELAATCTACQGVSYNVGKPLAYDYDLSRAARFHATSMRVAGSGLQHVSVCKLVANLGSIYPQTCDGSPSCACEGGTADCTCSTTSCSDDSACGAGGRCDVLRGRCYYCKCNGDLCTSTAARVARFGGSYRGENAAAGRSDPRLTFAQWINSSGHRDNLMNGSHGAIGTGEYGGAGKCWSNFWVQVFGFAAQRPTIAGAVAYPQRGKTSTTFDFTAVYYDQSGAAPVEAQLNIDGSCEPLALERGVAGHGSYRLQRSGLAQGCRRYVFVFRDAAGTVHTFPSQGSYGVGIDDPSCPFYDNARPSGCGATTSGDAASDSARDASIAGADARDHADADVGDARSRDAGAADDSTHHEDDARGKPPAEGGPTLAQRPGASLYGSCAVGARPASALPWLLPLLLLVLARATTRRRCGRSNKGESKRSTGR
ncbi:MAG: CAP domain-containing protein [Myxococcales bacterium]|nr:CAP domain-containing protein [Myxococcales bacterium]